MRAIKKSPNQDDFKVLLVGFTLTLVLYFVIAPIINDTCVVHENGSITFLPFYNSQENM
jgi:hypothetical protein